MPATVTITLTLCGSVCLSVLPLGCAMVGNPFPRGHGLLLGSQLSSPHPPDALTPPNFFIHLQNSPKSE